MRAPLSWLRDHVALPPGLTNQEIPIPGLGSIHLGHGKTSVGRDSARAAANAIRIHVEPTDTYIRIGHSRARMSGGITQGLMNNPKK